MLGPNNKKTEAGYTAVEMMVCLIVMLQLLLLASNAMKKSNDRWEQSMAAHHLNVIGQAASHYVQDHLEDLFEDINNHEDGKTLDLETLQSDGYLPPEFINQSVFQQSAKVVLHGLVSEDEGGHPRPETPKVIQILTYTIGGQSLSDSMARAIADTVGNAGGYLPQPLSDPSDEQPPSDSKTLIGSCKGWTLDVSNVEDFEPGHVALLNYANQIDLLSAQNFLRAVKVINTTRYNVMRTHLGIQKGAMIQFLNSDNSDEEINPQDTNLTSIQSKEIRLGNNAYWNESEGLVMKDGGQSLQIQPSKIILKDGAQYTFTLTAKSAEMANNTVSTPSSTSQLSSTGLSINTISCKANYGAKQLDFKSASNSTLLSCNDGLSLDQGTWETRLHPNYFYIYNKSSHSLMKYDPEKQLNAFPYNTPAKPDSGAGYAMPYEPQFIVRSGSGGRRWFGVGFNGSESYHDDINFDRIEFVDFANLKTFSVGLSGVSTYKYTNPTYSNKPHPDNMLNFIWHDSPYIYLGNNHGGFYQNECHLLEIELLLTPNTCVTNQWWGDKRQKEWQHICK